MVVKMVVVVIVGGVFVYEKLYRWGKKKEEIVARLWTKWSVVDEYDTAFALVRAFVISFVDCGLGWDCCCCCSVRLGFARFLGLLA